VGQKVPPQALRLGYNRTWRARWYSDRRQFIEFLHEDRKIREFLKKKLYEAGISAVEVERTHNLLTVDLYAAKPGMVIGRGGQGVELLRQELEKLTGKKVSLNVREVKNPELDAQLVAESVAAQLEKRVSFRRAIKQAVFRAMRSGARGAKVMVSGRLGGAEIARREWAAEGSVPLHTLRADVDYGFAEAHTPYGRIGVKCWINRGEKVPELEEAKEES